MKTKKLIIFNIVFLLLLAVMYYVYFGQGTSFMSWNKGYITSIIYPVSLMFILFVIHLFTTLSFIVEKAKVRKNLLRVGSILLFIIFAVFFVGRISELIKGTFCISCTIMTLLILTLLVINIMILKDLYKLLNRLFNK